VLEAIPFGLAIGLAVGALGGGGSVLAVPILVYILGERVPDATTGSLVVVTAAALAGGLGHARARRVCWRHALSFSAAAVPGIIAGTIAGDQVSGRLILGGFALLMLAAGAAMWRKGEGEPAAGDPDGAAICPPLRLPRDLLAGAAIGFLTGFFGVGGGFLIVPTLAVAFAFTMRTAVGTSLAIISATSLIALAAHLASGRTLDLPVITAMGSACVVGALAGVRLASRVPQRALGRSFAVLIASVAAYLAVSAAFLGGPAGG
jgi:uncharacterized membrane protein YfcA